ncbi:MAG TPA: prolyl oligopeptidase family serine peptidase [Pyrinomonadaceae bacterium]|nr:prolyl oligopeptidase family serine peptidase [Pyrinomonadaceae bacterium]
MTRRWALLQRPGKNVAQQRGRRWTTRDLQQGCDCRSQLLKSQNFIDPERIAMSGGSYGGIQDLLTAEKDPGIRAYVPFTPGTESWGNTRLRDRLIKAVQNEKAPMFVIQAEGDYSLGPVTTLMPILAAKGNQEKWKVKLYPKFGCDNKDAHSRFAGGCDGIAIWEADVLAFLEKWVK